MVVTFFCCNNKILNKKTIVKKKKSVFLKFFKLRRLDGQQLTIRSTLGYTFNYKDMIGLAIHKLYLSNKKNLLDLGIILYFGALFLKKIITV